MRLRNTRAHAYRAATAKERYILVFFPATRLSYSVDDFEATEGFVDLGPHEHASLDFLQTFGLPLDLGSGKLGHLRRIVEGDHRDAIAIGDEDVSGSHRNSATCDDGADFAGAVLITAIRAEAARVDGQAESLQSFAITNHAIHNYSRDAELDGAGGEELAETRADNIALCVDDQDIPGTASDTAL